MSAVQFSVLVRLPFVRGDFVDPPQVDWNAAKDRALWKVISKSSKTSDLNWAELAERHQVPQTFLLQQAAWLYERHFEHVRSQMKKMGSTNASNTAGSGSGNTNTGGVPMQRGGSHGSRGVVGRAPSVLSTRSKDAAASRSDNNSPAVANPVQPSLSRTPSTNTITQSRAHGQFNAKPQSIRSPRPSLTGARPGAPPPPNPQSTASYSQVLDDDDAAERETVALSSSSATSDSDDAPVHRSQLFRRPPRFQKQRPKSLLSYDEDLDEDDGERSGDALLPFAQAHSLATGPRNAPTMAAPPRTNTSRAQQPSQNTKARASSRSEGLDVSSSLASSASDVPKPSRHGPGPISPKHRAELAKLSPRGPGTRSKKEGSEGTPSMGSSFSDIDVEASISQSALEEALLSNIHAGRMSTLSNLRSRYL